MSLTNRAQIGYEYIYPGKKKMMSNITDKEGEMKAHSRLDRRNEDKRQF